MIPTNPYASPRIIPARAGFTRGRSCKRRGHRDHPRSRGVYAARLRASAGEGGSSPLARGLRQGHPPHRRPDRIIPARAGFTSVPSRAGGRVRDHPRSRGVYRARANADKAARGSSPLARGLRSARTRRGGRDRIIPARAGFTLANPWNPNEPVVYQTPAAFTADPGPAPPSCGSAVVVPRWTTTPSGA